MFGRSSKKTLFDYIEEHEPYNKIDDIIRPNYLENTAPVEHKNLETDISEYWDLLHPLVADFINSYAKVYQTMAEEISESRGQIESIRRQLTFEQQNVNDLNDKLREMKATLQEEAVVRRDLEERLRDTADNMKAKFEEEKRALELIASDKIPEGATLEQVMEKVQKGVENSAEVKRLKEKVKSLEEKIEEEREENEKIQSELSTSFMEKITKMDEMIYNLKQRVGDDE